MNGLPAIGMRGGTFTAVRFTTAGLRPAALVAILSVSALLAAALIVTTGTRIEPAGFARFAALAAGLGLLCLWCHARRLDPRLASAAAIVSVGTVSLMLCGIVSNLGLRLGAPLADSRLAFIDATVGLHVDQVVRSAARSPLLIDVLAFVYNASGIAVVALILAALAFKARERAWELATTAVTAMQTVAVISILLPAIGTMHHFGLGYLQGNGLPPGAGVYHLKSFMYFYTGADSLVRLEDLEGLVTFPSFHTVLALLVTQALAPTRYRWLGVGWTATVIVSTIPIGGHYVVDLIAGFLIWAGAAVLASRLSSPSA